MNYLLDTNICSAHMRRPGGLAHRFMQYSGRLQVPTIALAELYAGAYLVHDPRKILDGINDFLLDVQVVILIMTRLGSLVACADTCNRWASTSIRSTC